jgi:hypothetical protein
VAPCRLERAPQNHARARRQTGQSTLLCCRRAASIAQGLWHDRTINDDLDAGAASDPSKVALTALQVESAAVRRFTCRVLKRSRPGAGDVAQLIYTSGTRGARGRAAFGPYLDRSLARRSPRPGHDGEQRRHGDRSGRDDGLAVATDGCPLPGARGDVIDADGTTLPSNQVGKLMVSSRSDFGGWRRPTWPWPSATSARRAMISTGQPWASEAWNGTFERVGRRRLESVGGHGRGPTAGQPRC